MQKSSSIRRVSSACTIGLILASAFLPAQSIASDQVLQPYKCIEDTYDVVAFYKWKDFDDIRVARVVGVNFHVSIEKDGKYASYNFDGCTHQSRKIR
jgi:hypothetical protein